MQGQIEAVNRSQSGKTLGVKVGEQWYTTKNWELEGMVGKSITFEPSSSEFNGKVMYWLNDYVEVGASTTPADQAFDAAHNPMGAPAPPQMGAAIPTAAVPPTAPQTLPMPPQATKASGLDRDASIIAQALTKACNPATMEEAWKAFMYFYHQVQAFQRGDFSDPIPFS